MKLRQANQRLLLALWLAGLSTASGHAADPVEALKACAKMTDRGARFACYDELGQRVLEQESAEEQNPPESVVEAAATTTATAATAPTMATEPTGAASETPSLPDDLGGTSFEKKSENGRFEHKGLVTSCKKGGDDRWYFYFENGQVWRQSNRSRRRFKECHFFVTITRDAFGYKMQIDGDKGKIRVARKK
jgi:curved DNA-binding protein CbpA